MFSGDQYCKVPVYFRRKSSSGIRLNSLRPQRQRPTPFRSIPRVRPRILLPKEQHVSNISLKYSFQCIFMLLWIGAQQITPWRHSSLQYNHSFRLRHLQKLSQRHTRLPTMTLVTDSQPKKSMQSSILPLTPHGHRVKSMTRLILRLYCLDQDVSHSSAAS